MTTLSTESAPPHIEKFSSPEGQSFVRKLLQSTLPYDPHDYQVEGSGKTGFFSMYMLLLRALSADSNLCSPPRKISLDPAMVVICPTIGLEEDMAKQFNDAGLTTLIINHKTIERSHVSEETSLWVRARTGVSMVIMSPELLASKGFEGLLQHKQFSEHLWGLRIDELHLLNTWSAHFRKAFWQIGYIRAHMPTRTVLIGVTATLAIGSPMDNVLKFLRLRPGDFHLIQQSNRRPDLRIVYRTLTTGLGGWKFPDLKHVLDEGRKTVIYCKTISLSFRLMTYLVTIAPASPPPLKRIRLYNSLNQPEYNEESRRLFEEGDDLLILIATDSLMVGVNLRNVARLYQLEQPLDVDEATQKDGRNGRDAKLVKDPVCFTFWRKNIEAVARAVLDGKSTGGKNRSIRSAGQAALDPELARLILVKCRTVQQDQLYGNPPADPLCSCSTCASKPPLTSMPCISSCCVPEEDSRPRLSLKCKPRNPVKRSERLTKIMRAVGKKSIEDLRWKIYLQEDRIKTSILGLDVFLPDEVIKASLDRFALLTEIKCLDSIFEPFIFAKRHQLSFWILVIELGGTFAHMREEQKKKKKDDLLEAIGDDELEEDADSEEGESEEDEDAEEDSEDDGGRGGNELQAVNVDGRGLPRLVIRVPPRPAGHPTASDLDAISQTPPQTPTCLRTMATAPLSPARRHNTTSETARVASSSHGQWNTERYPGCLSGTFRLQVNPSPHNRQHKRMAASNLESPKGRKQARRMVHNENNK
ncbi:hypothetical protein NM688_g7019 [Phlebia brevispora]|uniref:Uncharacterized protein n=1 Tax=Phlebia brevispora TaxID=194682 RepID=A0ACC1SA21_9APHY|nr:hypothetical protein NM688_g7019 [Phlebia brevispora]